MPRTENIDEQVIKDICESLIEDAQTQLMYQKRPTNKITVNLTNYMYTNDDIRIIKKEVVKFLQEQEIRLYEETCDPEGNIIDSEEKYVKIFDEVKLNEAFINYTLIDLVYSEYMMDLLTS